jgi:transcriptional regulator with GAF, ATPase, and Fis domain
VLGRPARIDTVAAIASVGADIDVDHIRPALRELPLQESRRGELGFRRAALGPAIADALDPAEREALHRRAVEVLLARGAAPDSPAVVGHHIGAGDVDAVAGNIVAAVESIAAGGDHAAALRLGERALGLLGAGPSTRDLRRRLGQLARLGGDAERCRTLLAPLADGGDAVAALALARALDAAGDADAAERRFRQAMADPATAAPAARDLCDQLLRRGETEAALEIADVDPGDDPHLEAARAYALGVLGRDDGAVDRIEAIGAVARSGGDRDLEAAAMHLAGRLAYRRGDWRATRRAYERALEAAEAAGDMVRVGTLRMNLAAMDQSIGEWRRARDFGNQAVSLLRAAGARTYALIARRNLGQLLCELGQYQRARRELTRAAAEADALEMPVHRIGIDAMLGIVAARMGELSTGRELLAGAAGRFDALGDDRRRAETLLDLAELELELAGDAAAGDAMLDRAEALEPTRAHPGRRCRLAAARALAAALRGDRAATREHLRELDAVEGELAEQGGDPLRAELHRLAARAAELAGDRDAAARHRTATVELLEIIAADLSPADRLSFWQDPRRRDLSRQRSAAATTARGSTLLSTDPLSVDRLFRILDIYRQLSGEADPDRLLEQAMDRAIELFGASRGFLLLTDNGGGLRTAVARNLPAQHLDSMRRRDSSPAGVPTDDLPYSRTVAEEVFRTGDPIIGDVRLDSRFANAASVHALEAPTVICVPACAAGEVVGALYLESATSGLAVGPDDARLLGAFGDQIAVLLREAETKRVLAQRADALERARAEIEGLLAERTRLLERRTEELELVKRDLSQISRRLLGDGGAFGLIGSSRPMERIYEAIDRAARADVPILITGESGTGKELVARALHQQSDRAERKLVAVNCGALPETLLESELFGHERGAFTGADRARRGLFETAHGGTLFLDEIGETPPRMQAALLRALSDGIIRRVGGAETIAVDVRIIAATNRDLRGLVEEGRFRTDLLYRLEVVPIRVPPLRERLEDVPLLVEHFLAKLRDRTNRPDLAVSSDALKTLMSSPWPGNVRQLEHALTSAAVMAARSTLETADFDAVLGATPPAQPRDREREEREAIREALEQCGWNKSKAARVLGIPRRTFYRRLKKYDIG